MTDRTGDRPTELNVFRDFNNASEIEKALYGIFGMIPKENIWFATRDGKLRWGNEKPTGEILNGDRQNERLCKLQICKPVQKHKSHPTPAAVITQKQGGIVCENTGQKTIQITDEGICCSGFCQKELKGGE